MDQARLHEYRLMMADTHRMVAYQASIEKVCPHKIVCEIGVGLGPLSLMALKAGARRVYGIEADAETLQVATEIIRAAGFGPDRFIPIEGLSTAVTLPERAEVLISETLDSSGVGEGTV